MEAACGLVVVYTEALSSGWVDYSFPAGVSNFASTAKARGGTI